jgi:thiamine biosynthesis lipoprotein
MEAQMHSLTFRAMGCAMGAWVLTADSDLAQERLNLVRTWMTLVDKTLTRFHPGSELMYLNVRPATPVRVSSLLWDALTVALHAAQEIEGRYDPTIFDALLAAGYDRDFDEIATVGDAPEMPELPRYTWRDIARDPITRTVTLPPGLHLDLGGTAKGWAATYAAGMLASLGPCLVDAGGDLAVRGAPPGLDGWSVGVAAPDNEDKLLAHLVVKDCGVATSGVDYRRWRRGGVEQHHIIDPRTQRPAATDLRTATVIAPDATQADLYALVVMLLGREQGLAYLQAHPGLDGLLVDNENRQWLTPGMSAYLREM